MQSGAEVSPPGIRWIWISLVFAFACVSDNPLSNSQPSLLSEATTPQAGAQRARYQTLDDQFAELADRVPGFGGLFYDSAGRLVINLKYPQIWQTARPVIAEFLRGRVSRSFERLSKVAYDVEHAQIRRVSNDYRTLLTWYESVIIPAASREAGIVASGVDERSNQIRVRVERAALSAMRQRLAALALPPEAVTVVEGNPAGPQSNSLDTSIRPVIGGAKIETAGFGDAFRCGVGFNLIPWINGSIGSSRYFVTASHCAPPYFVVSGSVFAGQPTQSSNTAVELVDPTNFTNTLTPRCPAGKQCRFSDAALFVYQDPADSDDGMVAYPGLGSITYTQSTSIYQQYVSLVGDPVHLIGNKSGRRSGHVVDACEDWTPTNTSIVFICQTQADYQSDVGDSGSPVIEPLSGGVSFAVGIHVAAAPFFSPLSAALWEIFYANTSLGVLDPVYDSPSAPSPPGAPPASQPLSVSIGGPSVVGPNNYNCSVWAAVVQGGTSPFEYSWTGAFTGTEPAISFTVPEQGADLQVYVTDAQGRAGIAQLHITYDPNHTDWCE